MKIKINENLVDFEAPVYMTVEQREKFISFLEGLFPNRVNVEEIKEPDIDRKGPGERKEWEVEEYLLLLGDMDAEDIAEETGRSSFSVRIKRGKFNPQFMAWARAKGYTREEAKTEKAVEEYLEEE